jgi:3-oxoacyl-(acyl-carrier-protein) synthase
MQASSLSFSITGIGLVTPAGNDIKSLWEDCLDKKSFIKAGLGRIETSEIEKLWEKISTSKWIKKNPILLSRSFILTVHSIIHAIDQAKWECFTEDDVILIGTTTGEISLWENDLIGKPDNEDFVKEPLQSLSDNLKATLNFPGKIIIIASACSASTQAFIAAHNYLASKRASRCIAGGVEELSKLTITGFNCLKLLSLDPCKPFDQSRIGINLSEGAAFYTIENNSLNKPLAYLYAGDTVLDSYHMTSPSIQGEGLQKALRSVLKKNNLAPSDISIVHAHGTGSIQNDYAEAYAINEIFSHRPHVVSTKGIHGHALGASGAIELGICINILIENTIPPVTGLDITDTQITLNLSKKITKKEIKFLAKTTLGFGGVNSTFIIGKENHA